jgi:hypothetical protein
MPPPAKFSYFITCMVTTQIKVFLTTIKQNYFRSSFFKTIIVNLVVNSCQF